jgi:acyl-CoA thioester hydrolase
MSKLDPREPYDVEITIKPEDIDWLGHVNNVVYLKWVQEAATTHWYALATEEQKAALLWVVARHEIDYKRPAMESDEIVARTWIGKADKRAFARHTEIIRKADNKLLAKAVTQWVPVDVETKRAVTAGPEIYAMFGK